jgi:hypothetical protein
LITSPSFKRLEKEFIVQQQPQSSLERDSGLLLVGAPSKERAKMEQEEEAQTIIHAS